MAGCWDHSMTGLKVNDRRLQFVKMLLDEVSRGLRRADDSHLDENQPYSWIELCRRRESTASLASCVDLERP